MKLAQIAKDIIDIISLKPFDEINGLDPASFEKIMEATIEEYPQFSYEYAPLTPIATREFILKFGATAFRYMECPTSVSEDKFRAMIVSNLDEMIKSLVEWIPPGVRVRCPHCAGLLNEKGEEL